MRAHWVCLLLLAAAPLASTLHAATRAATHHLSTNQVALHHADALTLHRVSFSHRFAASQDLPAEPLQSFVNPSGPARGFSLISFAIHSILGFFSH